MDIIEILKKQNAIEKSFVPYLKNLNQIEKVANASLKINDVSTFFSKRNLSDLTKYFDNHINRANFFTPSKVIESISKMNVNSLTDINTYIKNFDKINKAEKFSSSLDLINFAYSKFEFPNLIDEEENSEHQIITINETKRIQSIITDIYSDNSVLFTIQPREFEEIVAELLYSQGFKVELTKQTRDNGYDILALKYLDGHIPLKFLVECKKYTSKKIGVEVIRSFKEVISVEKANRGMIVTTSYFSSEAKKKQKEIPYLLDYRDKDEVIQWVKNYYNVIKLGN